MQLDAAAGHPTDARDALVSDFKANLKFAERFPHLKVLYEAALGVAAHHGL